MATKKKLLQAAAGTAAAGGAGGLNIEDVFSTYLWDGNSSTQTITNGIDLSGEGGLVWIKNRTDTDWHVLNDTERGANSNLYSNETNAAAASSPATVSAFNGDGFTLNSHHSVNETNYDYASWTFRKAPKFFDVVTYTGTGSNQAISHNLGTTVGCIIVKELDNASDWRVYHRSLSSGYNLALNTTDAQSGNWSNRFVSVSDTSFTVGTDSSLNENNVGYVAYLFAHNDGDGNFGPTGDQDIIKCGSYTGTTEVDLGFEPQWILRKRTDSTGNWALFDTMRGWGPFDPNNYEFNYLLPNTSDAEATSYGQFPTSTGFTNSAAGTYIYIAIRRGPMAVPTDATDVFAVATGNSGANPDLTSGFPVDFAILRENFSASQNPLAGSRLQGANRLKTPTTDAEAAESAFQWDFMDGWFDGSALDSGDISWMWKRAPNYFDVVAYTGNGTAGHTVSHNLGVAPEMTWVKRRDSTGDWTVVHKDYSAGNVQFLQATSGEFSDSTRFEVDASNITLPTNVGVNGSGGTYIAYLFASLDGVSKVGSFSYTYPSDLTVDCGFTSGPRFLMIKKTSATGGWIVIDTERGFTSGNDPWLQLNTTTAQNTSWDIADITPTGSGFIIPSNGLLGSGDYIFYAVA